MKFIEKETFFMRCASIPSGTAQQRKSAFVNGRIVSYPSESYKRARRQLYGLLRPHAPKIPFEGPVYLSVAYKYETSGKSKVDTFKTSRPDGDNLLKVLKDVMGELGFYHDDSEVAIESIARMWVAKGEGGILVTIGQVEEEVF